MTVLSPAGCRLGPVAVALSSCLGSAAGLHAQEAPSSPGIEADVWIDRGEGAVLGRGERSRVYYSTAEDAFVAIFRLDTDGNVHLLHPRTPDQYHHAQGGREYRLLFRDSPYWIVEDAPGLGYYFIVASKEPFDFSSIPFRTGGGWDLDWVGRQVYTDPYEAIDVYVEALIPDWEYVPFGVSLTEYHVGDRYDYPRFMCYDCHTFQPYERWNPYRSICADFRVVVWNDPYDYPALRFGGSRVVYPRRPTRARYEFKEVELVGGRGPALHVEPPRVRRGAFPGRRPVGVFPPRSGEEPRVRVGRPRDGRPPGVESGTPPRGPRVLTGPRRERPQVRTGRPGERGGAARPGDVARRRPPGRVIRDGPPPREDIRRRDPGSARSAPPVRRRPSVRPGRGKPPSGARRPPVRPGGKGRASGPARKKRPPGSGSGRP